MADITYLPTQEGAVYLSLVTNAFLRKIVGYHVRESLHTESVAQAQRRAVEYRQTLQPLVHRSDRGSQYCSRIYQELHAKYGIRCSMTDDYDCYQNAFAERVNGTLNTELLLQRPQYIMQAKTVVSESVSIYNRERPQPSLNHKTLDSMHWELG